MVFRPLPVLFPGRHTTSIDSIPVSGLEMRSSFSARRLVMLKLSDPQKRMRKGSHAFTFAAVESARRVQVMDGSLLTLKRLQDEIMA
jgi:hypothetical protein